MLVVLKMSEMLTAEYLWVKQRPIEWLELNEI